MGLPTQHLLPSTLATNHTAALPIPHLSHRHPHNAVPMEEKTKPQTPYHPPGNNTHTGNSPHPYAMVSAERRARAQWYIDDLRSQGFNVVDAGSNYYRHGGGATRIENYSDVASTAKAINCSSIQVRCGTPTRYLFFMGDGLQIVFYKPQVPGPFLPGEYLYYAPYDPNRGIILLPSETTPTPK
jgi:hypothetical protein